MLLGQGLGLEEGLGLELCPCQHPRWPIAPGAESVPCSAVASIPTAHRVVKATLASVPRASWTQGG